MLQPRPEGRENRTRREAQARERLAYWFFRLNGCLTTPNFLVHQEERNHRPTEVDVIAVRFPYRREMLSQPMEDHAVFERQDITRPSLFIVEVKPACCELNGPWSAKEEKNMERVLRAVGLFPDEEIDSAAAALYNRHKYDKSAFGVVSLIAIGDTRRDDWDRRGYEVEQVLWNDILAFVHKRFTDYADPKRQNSQWEELGRDLYRQAIFSTPEEFQHNMRQKFGLPTREQISSERNSML